MPPAPADPVHAECHLCGGVRDPIGVGSLMACPHCDSLCFKGFQYCPRCQAGASRDGIGPARR